MENDRFKIVFEKLEAERASTDATLEWRITDEELDEIRELRRLAIDLTETPSKFYTST